MKPILILIRAMMALAWLAALAFVVLAPAIALAQEAAAGTAGMDAGQIAVMITGVAVSLLAVVATALGFWKWLRTKMSSWGAALDAKTGVPIFGVLFEKAVSAFSLAFEQMGPEFRKVTADGHIDPAEWDLLKNKGLEILKQIMHPAELEALSKATNGNIDTYLEGIAPHAIAASKTRGAGAKTAVPSPGAAQLDPSAP